MLSPFQLDTSIAKIHLASMKLYRITGLITIQHCSSNGQCASRRLTKHLCIVNPVSTGAPSSPRQGRPRNADVDRDVVDSVLEMVSDGATLSSLSFVSIAQNAGVSRNAIYRRWKTKERLLVDVVKSIGRAVPELTQQSARENLVMVLDFSFAREPDPRVNRLERAINAEAFAYPDLFEHYTDVVVAPLRGALQIAIRRGKDTGEIRVDVDENVLVELLSASPRVRAVTGSQRLVDLIFDGVNPA